MIEEVKTKEFVPVAVGTDWRTISKVKRDWEDLTFNATNLYDWALSYTGRDSLPVDEFLTLVTDMEPSFVVARLLEISGKAPKGFNLKALIEKGLIDNEFESEVFAALQSFREKKEIAEKLFRYDLKKLFKDEYFDLDEHFQNALEKKFTSFTKSEKENEALEKLKELVGILNYFSELRLAKPKMGVTGLNSLLLAIRANDDRTGYTTFMNFFNTVHWKSLNI